MIVSNHMEYNHFDVLFYQDINGVAGNAQSINNPGGADFQLVHLQTTFTTDANAANRLITLSVIQDTITIVLATSPSAQAASLTYHYYFAIGLTQWTSHVGSRLFAPLADRLRLRSTSIITLNADNMQVGDQFTNTRTIRNLWQSV